MADGSVIFSTALDNKQLEKELARAKKEIGKLEQSTSAQEAKKSPLVQQAQELEQNIKAARAEVEKYRADWLSGVAGADKEQSNAIMKTQQLESEHAGVVAQIDKIDAKLQPAYAKLDAMKISAGGVEQELAKASGGAVVMKPALDRAQKSLNRFSMRLREVVRSALIFTVISQGFAAMRNWLGKVIKTNSEASASIARLKGALLTMAQPLIEVIIPVLTRFVNILTEIVSAVANVLSVLFGSTLEKSADSAESLYNEQDALSGVGSAAKQAKKDLASFDEINKLTGGSSGGSSGGSKLDSIKPDFSFLKDSILSDLTIKLKDILFKWDDLTGEDILSKVITALTIISGGLIGFTVGGAGGAALGIIIGAGIGIAISNLTFNGDGKLDGEEILKTLILFLGMLAGSIVGFTVGGPGGAAIGLILGAGVSLKISKLLFNGDGKLSHEEIISGVIFALGAIVGGIIGFSAGGPAGAAVGIIVGAGVTALISNLVFNGDGKVDIQEVLSMIRDVLIIICAGALGFAAGGPGGAAIGVIVGAGIIATVSGVSFDADGNGKVDIQEILSMIRDVLIVICAGALGFAIGGPGGAAIGVIVGAGIVLSVKDVSFSDKTKSKKAGYDEGKEIGDNVTNGTRDRLGVRSPSTEYKEIGSYMMQGMASGINEDSSLVTQANDHLLNSIRTSFDAWQGNFMLGFDTFEESFTDRWKSFWHAMHVMFAGSWNNILNSFQDGCNNAIQSLNELVSSANMLSGLTGKKYKFAQGIVVPQIPIPKLATGAVIPPNREFLAVLGDQKSGTNIEAPLDTIVQAVMLAMAKSNNSGSGQVIENAVYLDGEVIYRNQKKISKRHGVNLTGR